MKASRILPIIAIIALFLLASCRSGSDFMGKQLPAEGSEATSPSTEPSSTAEPESQETQTAPSEPKPAEPEPAEIAAITEAPKYDVKNQCTIDSLGVVRLFDDEGKKRVFRPFCDGDSIVSFSCIEGAARPSSKSCPNGCMISTTNGLAECRATRLPTHKPKPVSTDESRIS